MKKYKFHIIGALFILLGVGMFFFGVSMFTYQGPGLDSFVSKLGMYSFSYWLPTFMIGIVFLILGKIFSKEEPVNS